MSVESLETRRVFAALPYGASENDLGELLLGKVAVTPVFFQSNGQLDPSTEQWTTQHTQEVLANINEGLKWWVDTLATKTTIHSLEFTVDTTYAVTPAATRYEPIGRRSNDYSLYISEFLAKVGFGTTGNVELDVKSFNQSQREKLGADWSYTIFVVPSQNDADGQFASGGSFNRAFAFAGGLFMVVPSTRPASTYTHESGHIFWARDEYLGGGSSFQRRGYYNTQNTNAADNPAAGFVQQPSIMASGTLLDTAYANHISPSSTLAMLGWQDSDGDGIFDALDVPHLLTGTGYFDTATATYRFNGKAIVQTLPNLNSSGLKNDITLNKIREIEYRFNGGAWKLYSAPDSYEASLDLTISVPPGATNIEIRARDSKTTVVSNIFSGRLARADATLVPGINGFTWFDGNKNGLRDVGEYGQEFWSVSLVDSAGAPLNLRKVIEPDNLPDGQLANGFSPHVQLSAIGIDTDGRVGVFADTITSTGNKNFRGFSRSSQSYIATWNSDTRQLNANFTVRTSVVSIDAVGSSTGSYGRLEAYNSDGELLGRYTTRSLDVGQVETMTISRGIADIAYVIAGGQANTSVRLDNLQFGPATTTFTGSKGHYSFASLPAGTYNVKVTPNSGFNGSNPLGAVQTVTVIANSARTDVDFGFLASSSPWQNAVNAYDVNEDQFVTALDVLLIVNQINQNGSRDLRGTGFLPPPYIDVSGDSFVSALDVLLVVNFINQRGNGEGERFGSFGQDNTNLGAGSGLAYGTSQGNTASSGEGLGSEATDAARDLIDLGANEHFQSIPLSLSAPIYTNQKRHWGHDEDEELIELLAHDC